LEPVKRLLTDLLCDARSELLVDPAFKIAIRVRKSDPSSFRDFLDRSVSERHGIRAEASPEGIHVEIGGFAKAFFFTQER
jgi:hypothetical protein